MTAELLKNGIIIRYNLSDEICIPFSKILKLQKTPTAYFIIQSNDTQIRIDEDVYELLIERILK